MKLKRLTFRCRLGFRCRSRLRGNFRVVFGCGFLFQLGFRFFAFCLLARFRFRFCLCFRFRFSCSFPFPLPFRFFSRAHRFRRQENGHVAATKALRARLGFIQGQALRSQLSREVSGGGGGGSAVRTIESADATPVVRKEVMMAVAELYD